MNAAKLAVLEKRGEAPIMVAVISLDQETRTAVDTATAAYHLNRQPQTLRVWASTETFPEGLRPLRVNGRLGWPVSGLRKVLGVIA